MSLEVSGYISSMLSMEVGGYLHRPALKIKVGRYLHRSALKIEVGSYLRSLRS